MQLVILVDSLLDALPILLDLVHFDEIVCFSLDYFDSQAAHLMQNLGGRVCVPQGITVAVELTQNGAVLKQQDRMLAHPRVL